MPQTYTVGCIIVARPEWHHLVMQARRQNNAQGLAKPAGLPATGGYGVTHALRADGTTRSVLQYHSRGRSYQIGAWVTNAIPTPRRQYVRPLDTDGRIVRINAGTGIERRIIVRLDAAGLPVPVPLELSER